MNIYNNDNYWNILGFLNSKLNWNNIKSKCIKSKLNLTNALKSKRLNIIQLKLKKNAFFKQKLVQLRLIIIILRIGEELYFYLQCDKKIEIW